MYSVSIESHIIEKIRIYADLLLEGYLFRFSDTGMWESEVIIKDNYIQSAYLLVDSIYDGIVTVMTHEIVPHSVDGSSYKTATRIGSRSISIIYIEDTVIRTRYVSDIEIVRR